MRKECLGGGTNSVTMYQGISPARDSCYSNWCLANKASTDTLAVGDTLPSVDISC